MVKLKTNREIALFDKRQNSIGTFTIRLRVTEISANANGAVANGYYFYINDDENEILLDNFATQFSWENVALAESQLQPLPTNSLRDAFIQRIVEFSFIQQQIESGSNYGTVYEDWEIDLD